MAHVDTDRNTTYPLLDAAPNTSRVKIWDDLKEIGQAKHGCRKRRTRTREWSVRG
jgi:hypothetical protein